MKSTLQLAKVAIEAIFAYTPPYKEDGTSVLNDEAVELCNSALASIEEQLSNLEKNS